MASGLPRTTENEAEGKIRGFLYLLIALVLAGCPREPGAVPTGTPEESRVPTGEAPPVPEIPKSGENTYDLRGVIVSRDAIDNTLTVEHGPVDGLLDAGRAEYPLREARVEQAPADRSRIVATLHVTEGERWLTDVRVAE